MNKYSTACRCGSSPSFGGRKTTGP